MDEVVRAFKAKEGPKDEIEINERTLAEIKDIAHQLINREPVVKDNCKVLFLALHNYMTIRGAKPNFKVSL